MVFSVRLSVRHTFLTMFPSSYRHEIFRSYYQWQKWRPCKKSRSEVKGQGHRALKIVKFEPNWVFPDCHSSLNSPMATEWCTKLEVVWKKCPIVFQGHPSNCKVRRLKKLSLLTQIRSLRTVTPVWIHQWLRNDEQSMKWHGRGALLFFKVIRQTARSHG